MARYFAILTIIALGVGFFSGLRVTQKAMLKTADGYLNELALYDFRLISTLGFTDSDVSAFKEASGVKAAEGSVSSDLICLSSKGTDMVLHAHTLLDDINKPEVIEGRLPTKADECLLDAKLLSGFSLGSKITLSNNNSEDTLENFSNREYTIVGFANSPYYINFERGTTSLGDGVVSGFVYLTNEGFNTDYYTEIFILTAANGEIYSDEYKNSIDKERTTIEKLFEERADIRFENIYSEAKEKIDDATLRLDEKRSELDEARKQLDDGIAAFNAEKAKIQKQLNDNKASLDEARVKLDAAQKQLEELKNSPAASLQDISLQIKQTEELLNTQEADYANSVEEYESALMEAQKGFEENEEKFKDAQAKIDEALPEIDNAEKEINDARIKLDDIKPATIYTLDRSSNIGYASYENDTSIVSGVSKVFPLFFFLVAALVCITTMTRMVSEKRTENGVLKAIGYGETPITAQFLFYAGSASCVGCIVGFLLGSKFLPMALWQVYHIMYTIERPILFVLDWKLFALCSVMYLFCSLGATWFVCRKDLSENAAELIRPKAPSSGKRILLERINFLWKHIKFLHKVSIRNILRYKKRMIMMIIGIGGCTALLIAGFGIRDSVQPVLDYQYSEIMLFDATVQFTGDSINAERQAKFLSEIKEVSDKVAFLHTENVDIIKGNSTHSSNLVVFDSDLGDFINLHNKDKKIDFPKSGEAVINYRFAKENGIKVGDILNVRNEKLESVEVKVTGIFDNYIYDYIYLNVETYNEQLGFTPELNTAYVIFDKGIDSSAAGALLLSAENVANVSVNDDMIKRVGSMMDSLDYIVLIVLVCAGALAFIVLYNLTNIVITERTREIATLKVLGFYTNEQNSYVFRENMVLTAVGIICGIPMGLALLQYVMAQIKISTFYFGCRLAPISYVWAVLLTFAFAVVVDLTLTSKCKNINMAEAMKAVE